MNEFDFHLTFPSEFILGHNKIQSRLVRGDGGGVPQGQEAKNKETSISESHLCAKSPGQSNIERRGRLYLCQPSAHGLWWACGWVFLSRPENDSKPPMLQNFYQWLSNIRHAHTDNAFSVSEINQDSMALKKNEIIDFTL